MTTHETDLLRRLESFRRDDLLAGIALAVSRIGGGGVMLASVTEAQADRCRRMANRRHRGNKRQLDVPMAAAE